MDNILSMYLYPAAIIAAKSVFLITTLLITIAFLLLADRKIWAAVQMRHEVQMLLVHSVFCNLLQDLLKFVLKEVIIPSKADKAVFLLAPFITTVFAISAWAVIPFDAGIVLADINMGVLYILAISSLGVYGIIMGGWASNSKYPFLGALKSAAQTGIL